ncbi:MAG: PcfK-like family protein [Bacteroidales bacterium]|nr:PcfK-like family protein [Bacteroidales bacterium]
MKTTDIFKTTIKSYLDKRAASDELFSTAYTKEKKNLDDCITYILNAVRQSDCNGFTDEEVYSMAVHYYDEDNIEVGKPVNCKVVVNHEPEPVVLTEEEKLQARQEAIEKEVEHQRELLLKKPTAKKEQPKQAEQISLF